MKIGFSANYNNDISKIITFFTEDLGTIKPTATHCFPILGELAGIELGLSADEVMINLVDINRYRNDKYALRIYEIPDQTNTKEWVTGLLSNYNQKIYPHFELLYFVFEWAKTRIFPRDKNDKNWIDYSYFCSELTALALKSGGYSGWIKGVDANSITPTELEDYVRTIPYAKLIENRS